MIPPVLCPRAWTRHLHHNRGNHLSRCRHPSTHPRLLRGPLLPRSLSSQLPITQQISLQHLQDLRRLRSMVALSLLGASYISQRRQTRRLPRMSSLRAQSNYHHVLPMEHLRDQNRKPGQGFPPDQHHRGPCSHNRSSRGMEDHMDRVR